MKLSETGEKQPTLLIYSAGLECRLGKGKKGSKSVTS